MWRHNSKYFILYIYFNGASTSPFAACSVNFKRLEEEEIIRHKVVTIYNVHFQVTEPFEVVV